MAVRPDPKFGYKQTEEHIAKRIKRGAELPHFLGDAVSIKGGRTRALRAYLSRPCERCGAIKSDRHHCDGNTANNVPDNISFLCRRCHMEKDGRLAMFQAQAKMQLWRRT